MLNSKNVSDEQLSRIIQNRFPYAKPYEGQIEAITKICRAFINGKVHVILDAPTGSGKSVIAWTVMNVLRDLAIINRSTVITATKALQNLYCASFPEMFPLKAKGNYDCPFDRGPYMSPECRVHTKVFGCKPKAQCPYVVAREEWCDRAVFRNTNTAFMLNACGSLVLENGRFADFMVIDEAHRLEEAIIEYARCVFQTKTIADINAINEMLMPRQVHVLIIRLLNHFGSLSQNENHVAIINDELKSIVTELGDEIEALTDRIAEYIDVLDPNDNEDERAITYLQQSVEELNDMKNNTGILCSLKIGTRIHVVIDEGYLELKIIDASAVSYQSLFQKATRFLHMSGTICGFEYHITKLGLNPDDCEYIKVKNHIPIQNRRINALGNFRLRSNDYMSNGAAIMYTDRILKYYQGKHGIIFCPSFDMCSVYQENSVYSDRLVIPETLEDAYEIMKEDNDKVLVSPSIIEGIDLKYDMCRFAIIPRIPYLYLGDEIVRIKLQTEPEFYYRTTIMKLVQVCGRGVRSADDYCDTYIYDPSLRTLLERNSQYVPDWFAEAVKWYF